MSRTLDAAAVLLPRGETLPQALLAEYLGSESYSVVAAKTTPFPPSPKLQELSSHGWILHPNGCGTRRSIESALAAHRLPFNVAVEVEGHELQLSLVVAGGGLGSGHAPGLACVRVPKRSETRQGRRLPVRARSLDRTPFSYRTLGSRRSNVAWRGQTEPPSEISSARVAGFGGRSACAKASSASRVFTRGLSF